MHDSGGMGTDPGLGGDHRPDVLVATPSALDETSAGPCPCSVDAPMKRLMLAVLLDAVVQLGSRRARRVGEAEEWIGGGGADFPFSFANNCEALGVESRLLARGLLAMRALYP